MPSDPRPSDYTAVVLTYRRPGSLTAALAGLSRQSHPPTLVVVVDNDPACSAEPVVEEWTPPSSARVRYLPAGANLGPAGGWAIGVAWAEGEPDRGSWVLICDDDDPIDDGSILRNLVISADEQNDEVAAVGLRGATLRRWTATLHRTIVSPNGAEPCDYLASGGLPVYRWKDIDEAGFFDGQLFFGFEDLELGLRLAAAGHRLLVVSVPGDHEVPDSSPVRTAWREYYKTRALVVIARRHLGRWSTLVTVVRIGIPGSLRLLTGEGGLQLANARWQGIRDAFLGRLGPAGHAPQENPPKDAGGRTRGTAGPPPIV